ncbi:hypothetical protein [Arthrobacter sp. UYEF36]|uniref:hypothetical protein n=1 Tax=Arthrobacter sp. UYEF36 TaxID=1756366 RepID=UPI0033970803
MIENDVLRWGLMALLLAASLYAAFRAGRQSPPATRAGYGLHAAMMIAMMPMLVPGLRWPALPQIVFFGFAAWWFILRAVARRPVQVAGLQVPAAGPGHGRGALLSAGPPSFWRVPSGSPQPCGGCSCSGGSAGPAVPAAATRFWNSWARRRWPSCSRRSRSDG